MPDQQQKPSNSIGQFNQPDQSDHSIGLNASLNFIESASEASLAEATDSTQSQPTEQPQYQHLDCSHVNVRTWHRRLCHMGMAKVL